MTKDILLSEIKIEMGEVNIKESELNKRISNVVYYVTGYVVAKIVKGKRIAYSVMHRCRQ